MDALAAALVVVEAIEQMARDQRPLMRRVLPDGPIHFWDHHPKDDARDRATRSRWYYHVHAPGDRDADEHGHFHLFLHRTQFAAAAVPLALPATGEAAPAHVAHLAALSIDPRGVPRAWFATNRWVTDEFLYDAETLIAHLPRFDVDHTPEDAAVNRLITAMVALYRDELAELLRERDAKLAALAAGGDLRAVTEAGHAVLASRPIDLDAKVESLGIA